MNNHVYICICTSKNVDIGKPGPEARAQVRPGAPLGRAGKGGPAAAWYFVYHILDRFGYVQFGHIKLK